VRPLPHPSPNHGPRRGAARIVLVVLHYTAMASAEAALARLSDPAAEVSAHYLIAEDGRLFALVPEERRAWHAGAGAWGPWTDVNSVSVGIEIANPGDAPFAARAMDSLEALLADLLARHRLPPQAVIGHSDCAPGRKADPGPRFDWRRLARSGLSVWPGAVPEPPDPDPARFRADLSAFGYTAAAGDAALLAAFRSRFRPGAGGPLGPADMGLAAALARRWPVDGDGGRA
jgi:N-acetylmuramoyl-L-alanine amidase